MPVESQSSIATLQDDRWTGQASAIVAASSLESGHVLFFPSLPFAVERAEMDVFSPALVPAAKNVSFDPHTGTLGGTSLADSNAARLRGLIARFSGAASALVDGLLPAYRSRIQIARASFRPVEIAGRPTSWRKDDTRLHIDSFPATPVQGKRILRVFSNVNPSGGARTWRVGEDFEPMARRFASSLRMPAPGSATLRRLVRLTKSTRAPYDALMLQLHDRMKADTAYQAAAPQLTVEFPAGSTWMAFTDQVSHAAMAGQYQLEQTFLLPVDAMLDERRSPLRVLERIMRRTLA